MAWPFITAVAPNVNDVVTLSNTPGAVITASTEWHLGRRFINQSGAQALLNLTDTAGNVVIKDQPVETGEQWPPMGQEGGLTLEPLVGVKAWCNQAVGVTMKRWGWS